MKEWRNFLTSNPSTINSSIANQMSIITEEQRLRLEQLAMAVDSQYMQADAKSNAGECNKTNNHQYNQLAGQHYEQAQKI